MILKRFFTDFEIFKKLKYFLFKSSKNLNIFKKFSCGLTFNLNKILLNIQRLSVIDVFQLIFTFGK
jgi:hypothetical protein